MNEILGLIKSLSNVASMGVEVKDLVQTIEAIFADAVAIEAGKRVEQHVGVLEIAGQKFDYGVYVQRI